MTIRRGRDLTGRKAVVTGAASGIGAAAVARLLAEGCTVLAVDLVAYATSKHAVLGLTRALAMELGPQGITVNCVQPGAIETGMTRPMFATNPDSLAYYVGRSALGRIGQPEDIADVMVFLDRDDARFITGQGIMVDGGVMVHS